MSSHLPSDAADLSLPSLANILEATSRYTGLSKQEIIGPRQQLHKLNSQVRARMWATYVARVTSKRSYPMIGKRLNRNHTTLIHAFHLATELIRRNDADTINAVAEITRVAWQLHSAAQESVRASA